MLMDTEKPGTERSWILKVLFLLKMALVDCGGLTPENVKRRSSVFQPDGVDVSSGVEKDGIKTAIDFLVYSMR